MMKRFSERPSSALRAPSPRKRGEGQRGDDLASWPLSPLAGRGWRSRVRGLAIAVLFTSCTVATPPPAPLVVPKDSSSYANPAETRVEHVSLDLTVDFTRRALVGTATLSLKRISGNTLVLDTRELNIKSITRDDGQPAPYRFGAPHEFRGTSLMIDLTPRTKRVTIAYSSSPTASALQWLDPPQTAGKTRPFLLSQSQSINARSWVPVQDTPSVRFTYDSTVRVPADLLALMSAENPKTKSATGVYRFRMPQPVPAYLLAISVGDLAFRAIDSISGVYGELPVVDRAAREFEDIPKMMTAAEELFGPYRWERYDVLVLPPSFPYGGMENPRLTFLTPTVIAGDKSLVSVIAHELAHSWSGNLVTNATWDDFWLNEGPTTYAERRIVEKIYGKEFAEMQWFLGLNDLFEEWKDVPPEDQGLVIKIGDRNPDEVPTGSAYDKGAMFLRMLEETAGRVKFDAFLRSYFSDFAFQSMTTERFVEILRARLLRPNNIDEKSLMLDAWLHGPGLPPNAPKPKSEAFTNVEKAVGLFLTGRGLETGKWSTAEWLHFIHKLPDNVTVQQLRELDRQFAFSKSGNAEILEAFLERAIDARYTDAYPAIERFLLSQGRRKYLKPLYTKLAATPEGQELALRIYEKARPTYHPISQATIDEILKWQSR